jgi:FKBP-type peptidyl-prolyl cis-trans isomerase
MKLNYIGASVIAFAILAGTYYFVQGDGSTESVKSASNSNTNKNMADQNIGGMVIVDEVIGTGATATAGDNVTVDYVGMLTNGTVFDASKNRGNTGFTFTLGAGQVIKGWDVGVAGMKVGGKRKLTIPADMAYGNQAVGGVIPANSTLVFEVELRSTGK